MMENWTPLKHHQLLIRNKMTSPIKNTSSNDGSLINTIPRLRAANIKKLGNNFTSPQTVGSSLKSLTLKGSGNTRNLQGS